MTAADYLRKARETYAERGDHTPPFGVVPSGKVCMLTALTSQEIPPNENLEAYGDAYRALAAVAREGVEGGVVYFNADHTTEEVLAAYDRAIEMVTVNA